ncbi:MAG: tetratricopeptide repeat protein [Pseudomonadota bacterium]
MSEITWESSSRPDLSFHAATQRPKLLFFHSPGGAWPLEDLVAALARDFQVVLSHPTSTEKFQELSEQADLVWFEETLDFLVRLGGRPGVLEEKRTILRLDDNRPFIRTSPAVAWEKINHLILTGESLAGLIKKRLVNLSSLVDNIHVINPGVKPGRSDHFHPERGKRLAYFGQIDVDAGPPAWLSIFRAAALSGMDIRLFIGQSLDDPLYAMSLKQRLREWGVSENVQVEGRIDSPAEWLADKGFLILETGPVNPPFPVLAALAAGARPLPYGPPLPGAFSLPGGHWSTEQELGELLGQGGPEDSQKYRDLAREKYPFAAMLEKTRAVIDLALRLEKGKQELRQGRLDQAHDILYPIIEKEIDNKEALNYLGLLSFQKGDLDRAADYFHTALRLDPYFKKAVLNFALVFRATNVLEKIEPLIKSNLDKYPGDPELSALLEEVERDFEEHGVSLGEPRKKERKSPALAWKTHTPWSSNPEKKAAAALGWIKANSPRDQGVIFSSKKRVPYPGAAGLLLPTLAAAGEDRLVKTYLSWLQEIQNPDGSFAGPEGGPGPGFDTGLIIRGLTGLPETTPQVERILRRACEWTQAWFEREGRLSPQRGLSGRPQQAAGARVDDAALLYLLPGLIQAGRYLNEPKHAEFALARLDVFLSEFKNRPPDGPGPFSFSLALGMDALFDLGATEIARKGMDVLAERMWPSGGIPAFNQGAWICTPAQALAALTWLKMGETARAKKIFDFLDYLHNPTGGLLGSYGVGAAYFPSEEISWPLKFYLDSLELLIDARQRPFDEDWSTSPGGPA